VEIIDYLSNGFEIFLTFINFILNIIPPTIRIFKKVTWPLSLDNLYS